MSTFAVRCEHLGKRYRLGTRQGETYRTLRDTLSGVSRLARKWVRRERDTPDESFWALRDVTFEIARGEVVGVIGPNGAGKSTLLKLLSRITPPSEGRAMIRGTVRSLLEVGTGFHGELSGRDNIYLSGAILGMKRTEIDSKFDEIVAFAEVERFLDTPVKHYSSGMYVRLAFAVAAHLEPEILLIDEVLAVGDAAFQKKCLGRMGKAATEGRTVMFVSHNMEAVNTLCQRGLLLQGGRLVEEGPARDIVASYLSQLRVLVTEREAVVAFPPATEKPAQLQSVAFTGPEGDARLTFDLMTSIRIRVEYEVRRDFECLVAFCEVRRYDGYSIYFTTDVDEANVEGPLQDTFPRAAGKYSTELVLPAPLLNVGIYEVIVGLWVPNVGPVHLHVGHLIEVVEPPEGSYVSYLTKSARVSLLAPVISWDTRSK